MIPEKHGAYNAARREKMVEWRSQMTPPCEERESRLTQRQQISSQIMESHNAEVNNLEQLSVFVKFLQNVVIQSKFTM